MSDAPWLVICGVNPSVWSYHIRPGKQFIGRSETCQVRIDHPSVSRRHAELLFERATVCVRDLNSRNGTFVDGKSVTRATLAVGRKLEIGSVALELVSSVASRWVGDPDTDEETGSVVEAAASRATASTVQLIPPAQRRVLRLLLEGLSEKQVAAHLGVSDQTVHWHVKGIYRALNVHSRAELMALCLRGAGGLPSGR
jgi:DNA-binding CsgD family transcriptional regulator